MIKKTVDKLEINNIKRNDFSFIECVTGEFRKLVNLNNSNNIIDFMPVKKINDIEYILLTDNIFIDIYNKNQSINCVIYEGDFDEFLIYLNLTSLYNKYDFIELSKKIVKYDTNEIMNHSTFSYNEIESIKKLIEYDFKYSDDNINVYDFI